ncbi:Uu.00g069130.m01.CDS01 [Anthostomella pinea]|uniref:Uu.00g069130.m01.CDS01 n=1 Tax=Anthostomella pinea TaxID=933095 RepID=A0AAI8VUG3_9PEZI|nr:Uu.00g069130.m01.CDS01 [Anthostomella pinea]
MSILCCCRSRRVICPEPSREVLELPTPPPRAKLSKSPFPRSVPDMSLSPVLSKQAPSLFTTSMHQAQVNPADIDADDSDEDIPIRNTKNSSTNTLEAIKTKLIRRLSQKSEPKGHSPQTLGNNDDELARRAELKRLMHKRIQEELKSEEEEGVKPTCLEPPRRDSCKEPDLPGGGPRDTIEFSVSSPVEDEPREQSRSSQEAIPLAFPVARQRAVSGRRNSCPDSTYRSRQNLSLDGNLPLRERGSLPQLPSSPLLLPVHFPNGRGSPSIQSWRLDSYSSGQLANFLGVPEDTKQTISSQPPEISIQAEVDQRYDDEEHKSPPKKDDHPSVNDPAESECPAEDSLEPMTPKGSNECPIDVLDNNREEEESIANNNDTSIDRYSPLDMWLRSQEVQSTSVVSSRNNSDMMLDKIAGSNSQQAPSETGAPNREAPQPPTMVLPEAAEQVDDPQRDPPGAWPRSEDASVGLERASSSTPSDESIALQRAVAEMSEALSEDPPVPEEAQQESSSRYTSSRYTTRPNSRQPTPKESHLKLTELLGGRKAALPVAPLNRLEVPSRKKDGEKSETSSYKTASTVLPSSDWALEDIPASRRATAGAISVAASETASFRHREAELKSIEQRFGSGNIRRNNSIQAVSRFQEDFDQPRPSRSSRHSIMAKFHLTVPKQAKVSTQRPESSDAKGGLPEGRLAGAEYTEHPYASYSDSAVNRPASPFIQANGGRRPAIVESATGVWQRAFKQEADRRESRSQSRAGSHKLYASPRGQKAVVAVSNAIQEHAATGNHFHIVDHNISGTRKRSTSQPQSPGTLPLVQTDRHEPNNASHGVLREWVNQLEAGNLQPHPESEVYMPQNRSLGRRTPPKSWAKWPSHSRHERAGAAGAKDHVVPRDFGVPSELCSDQALPPLKMGNGSLKKRNLTPVSRTLSGQFGRAVKGGWQKLISSRDNVDDEPKYSSSRSNSHKDRGHLEYPELELLPTPAGFREVQALEQTIDKIKHRSVSRTPRLRESSDDSTRPPLTSRIAEEVHKFQHVVENEPYSGSEQSSKMILSGLPMTPSQVLPAPRAVSGATEEFQTPGSHISYEDCVPTHMLDDDVEKDSIHSDDTTVATRTKPKIATGRPEGDQFADQGEVTDKDA